MQVLRTIKYECILIYVLTLICELYPYLTEQNSCESVLYNLKEI